MKRQELTKQLKESNAILIDDDAIFFKNTLNKWYYNIGSDYDKINSETTIINKVIKNYKEGKKVTFMSNTGIVKEYHIS